MTTRFEIESKKRRTIARKCNLFVENQAAGFRQQYSKLYTDGSFKYDCPEGTLFSLARRAGEKLASLSPSDLYLDLGCAKQIFEQRFGYNHTGRAITVDIADIRKQDLLARKNGALHLTANGASLPFFSNSFEAVVSNMALDFMPKEAVREVFRVLRPGGEVFVNLHHPNMIRNIDQMIKEGPARSGKTSDVLACWKYLKDHNKLYQTAEEVRDIFESNGFAVTHLKQATDGEDFWWEVDLHKPLI